VIWWWAKHPNRLQSEVIATETLHKSADWLAVKSPKLTSNAKISFDFDIIIEGDTFLFRLDYPDYFPDTPPSVFSRDNRRISGHQYGTTGELCLEWRADNWDPSVTGAMLIESTYRLISGERPIAGEPQIVPSAHQLSLGQILRPSHWRWRLFVTAALQHCLKDLPGKTLLPVRIAESNVEGICSAFVATIGDPAMPLWQDGTLPENIGASYQGKIAQVPDLKSLSEITKREELEKIYTKIDANYNISKDASFLILTDGTAVKMFYCYRGEDKVSEYETVYLSDQAQARLPIENKILNSKKVGVIGCGSLGSKILVSLARAGVQNFVIVDDDIFQVGNLVRNELDGKALGAHKVLGIEARIKTIAPKSNISRHRVMLGGQESSASVTTVIEELESCDLIVDATANSHAFNFASVAARAAKQPMLWTEVYAGGIGGFVGRVRPGYEPAPHQARQQYLAWCRSKNAPWVNGDDDYDILLPDAPPMIANDADISVIAAHATRMSLDTLTHFSESRFPSPAYVIGLSAEWIFSAPFDTHPITLKGIDGWESSTAKEASSEAVSLIVSLLDKIENADQPN
jgi:molybdopterin/thiamine biosynthesis adenylyltransferase/ubiquitin-protein ligase